MNILIVDDQPSVLKSIHDNVPWQAIDVNRVYIATSAREARIAMRSFDIAAVLLDIEMPEEDGLSLFRWMRAHFPQIEGIFLTSQSEFRYAQEAIHLGGLDYILQPFKVEDLVKSIDRVREILRRREVIDRYDRFMEGKRRHTERLPEQMTHQIASGEDEALLKKLRPYFQTGRSIYPLLLKLTGDEKSSEVQQATLPFYAVSILEEIFVSVQGSVAVSDFDENCCWLLLRVNSAVQSADVRSGIAEFERFARINMDISIAVYGGNASAYEDIPASFRLLLSRDEKNASQESGAFWLADASALENSDAKTIQMAKEYIARNLSRNISRADVARAVHLNEAYFSKLFTRQTGGTFKDYLLQEKMRAACRMLKSSSLSVSIIASKVGYDNFSHFSQTFKKIIGESPLEYRKTHEKQSQN